MEIKFKIIETPEYTLAVSDKKIENYYLDDVGTVRKGVTWDKEYWSVREDYKKIIAYQPKGNASELDLPLLPEIIIEDDVKKLAEEYLKIFPENNRDPDRKFVRLGMKEGFIEGYKTATKTYSEDDMRKAIQIAKDSMGVDNDGETCYSHLSTKQIIQSLKQPKTPKWFVAEIEYYTKDVVIEELRGNIGITPKLTKVFSKLKTTTINGKTYLVGTYLYE